MYSNVFLMLGTYLAPSSFTNVFFGGHMKCQNDICSEKVSLEFKFTRIAHYQL